MDIHVAIFEDNKLVREAFEVIFNGTPGFICTGAYADCNDLTFRIERCQPHVILMDIEMPGMDGIEATKIIAKQYPGIKVLIQTVFEDDNKIFAAICAGASGYILKRTPHARLVECVQEVFGGGAPMSPSIAKKVLLLFQKYVPASAPVTGEQEQLSAREKEILSLMMEGNNFLAIADKACISYETVRTHVKKIYRKLHVASASEAVAKAFRDKLI